MRRLVPSILRLALGASAFLLAACTGTPSPLAPAIRGSIGVPHQGMITNAARLPKKGEGFALYRNNGVQWGNPRLVAAIQAAARDVARARPGGAALMIGDLSAQWGGQASGHRSHRTGRDADLLIYVVTPQGVPVASPGFLRFGPDGLAQVAPGKFLRIDLERQWLLIKALVSSREANVQWLFFARWLEALVMEYARARGEDPELVWYAESVLLQPGDSAAHDDHLHLRVACTPDEAVAGCQGGGPYWPWLPQLPQLITPPDADLAEALIGDLLLPGRAGAGRGAGRVLALNLLAHADALDTCALLPADIHFDLVYLDPPYGVGTTMAARLQPGQARGRRKAESGPSAYEDRDDPEALTAMLAPRLAAIRDRMAPGATLYLHLDHRAVHELKVASDRIFGRGAFLGEVIWCPGNGGRGARAFSVTHQTILLYARRAEERRSVVYNAADPMLRESYAETSLSMHFKNLDEAGRRYRERVINGKAYRYYADEGRRLGSVWTDLPAMMANTPLCREATGYPTQKPEKLLERIVRASSVEGAVVADLMCGSGTTAAVAARLGRRFVAGDQSELAIEVASKRLTAGGAAFERLTRSRASDPDRASPRPAPPSSGATPPGPDPE